jgi:hypothetical protein
MHNVIHKCWLINDDKSNLSFDECLSVHRRRYEGSKTTWMLHNGLLNLMNRSTCFGHYYYAHHQELATIQTVPACGTSPWLWHLAGLVCGCRFKRPGGGMLHVHSRKLLMMGIMMSETC